MRISDWSSDVCSSDLAGEVVDRRQTDIADDVAGELPVGVEPARHHLDLDPRQLRRVDRNPGYILPAEAVDDRDRLKRALAPGRLEHALPLVVRHRDEAREAVEALLHAGGALGDRKSTR